MVQSRKPTIQQGPAGSPVVTSAEDWRLNAGGMVTSGPVDLAHRRGGVLPGISAAEPTVGTNLVSVAPFQAWIPGSDGAQQGGYAVTELSVSTFNPVSPGFGKFRRDRIIARVIDSLYTGTGFGWVVEQVSGAEADTAAAAALPTLPASSISLLDYAITAGGVCTVIATAAFTAATGGVVPRRSAGKPVEAGAHNGQLVIDTAGVLWAWNSSTGVWGKAGGAGIDTWTTATRPTAPTAYVTIGYNTDLSGYEFWNGTAWDADGFGGATGVVYDVQTYTTPGSFTWTKPVGALRSRVVVLGAGSGGGGAASSSSPLAGGAGGAGGAREENVFQAADLAATVAVTVGTGGAGGTGAPPAGGAAGVAGAAGAASVFGTVTASGGVSNGSGTGAAASIGGVGTFPGAGQVATVSGSNAGVAGPRAAGGPAGGSGAGSSGSALAGGPGGTPYGVSTTAPAGGTVTGGAGGVGGPGATPTAVTGVFLGFGGGGGASTATASTAGGAGGNGVYGGGGGGGGGSLNATPGAGGAGGRGGHGAVLVVTECQVALPTHAAPNAPYPNTTWDVQTYTTPGAFTWAKPTGAVYAEITVQAGGGGGGGGGAGTGYTGGQGGAGGAREEVTATATVLAATVAVTVGAGGPAGPGLVNSQFSGSDGTAGGNSSFGALIAAGGTAGRGGSTSVPSTPPGGAGTYSGGAGGTVAISGPGAAGGRSLGGAAGGGGGGSAANPGGAGGLGAGVITGAPNGGAANAPGTSATAPTAPGIFSGAGGGGGGGSTAVTGASPGGAGVYGGGGGGGGGTTNTSTTCTTGAGGKGGDGLVVVRTLCVTSVGTAPGGVPAIPASDKAAPNGVATLDSSGLVPVAQLPILGAYKATTTSRASTATLTLDPDLAVTVVPGTYWIELETYSSTGAGGLAWTFGGTATYTVPANAVQWFWTGSAQPPTVASLTPGTAAGGVPSSQLAAVRISLPVVVTAGGTVAFVWAQSTSNASPCTVNAGARMRAQKLA
jgi:hypothetical protein